MEVFVAGLVPDQVRRRLREVAVGLCLTTPRRFHITIMAPVVVLDRGLTQLYKDIAKKVADRHWAFLVRLQGPVVVIQHSGSYEDHYALRAQPIEELTTISQEVHYACGKRSFDRSVIPHLTVGKEARGENGQIKNHLNNLRLEFEFPLSDLAIMVREDYWGPYRVFDRVPFRGGEGR